MAATGVFPAAILSCFKLAEPAVELINQPAFRKSNFQQSSYFTIPHFSFVTTVFFFFLFLPIVFTPSEVCK